MTNPTLPKSIENKQPKSLESNKYTKKLNNKNKSLIPIVLNIITNNINGLKVKSDSQRLENMIHKMYDQDIDVFLVQTLTINMKHPIAYKKVQEIKNRFPKLQDEWSHTIYDTALTYKPGRTAIFVNFHDT